jgi:hypothetical protein
MHEEDNVKSNNKVNPIFNMNNVIGCDYRTEDKIHFIGKHYGFWKQLEKLSEETDELRHEVLTLLSMKDAYDAGDYENEADEDGTAEDYFKMDTTHQFYKTAEEIADTIVVIKTLIAEKPELANLVEAFMNMKTTRQAYRIATDCDLVGMTSYVFAAAEK